ncbi:unnamed protein product [Adineta steineri]|uniref:V-SNARE coiled-coil homology domain-containing protein n=1 Tax=Adineta steineri TaxID=433720 RepID=A0A814YMM1_9BILA|nr:unnamed protein product [Adineta steineri]
MTSRIKIPFKFGEKKINELEVNETSKKDDFSLSEIVRYGFPYRPTTLAYDPVQKILAIGTKNGIIKIYGGAFVECSLVHPTEVEIVQLVFRINEGALISACRDNYIHLWSLRQKKPVIAHSLRFVKEKISRCFLPLAFNSKWLLVGTINGNVYVVNLDTFTLSSYKIMWNNAIGMSKSTHPGVVVDLSQNPDDPTRLYIGFSTHLSSPNTAPIGHVICWNLQQKTSESVYTLQHGLTSVSWHHEGRQFMCSHCDGSLSVWNLRATEKPVSINYPHARISKDEQHKFGSVSKVVWTSVKNSNDPFIIFSGGMPAQTESQQSPSTNAATGTTPSKPSSYFLTILRGPTTNVLHMDNAIVDFTVITSSPHIADIPDPTAVVVLLENDLVVIDLKSDNYPLFESLHTLDLHESPVTFCDYITEPNTTFYQNLLRLQSKQTPKRTFSQQENPVSGGKSGSTIFGYNEVIMTGHADGSVKFWDASGCNLLFLYKLRTNRLFDRIQPANPSSSSNTKDVNPTIKLDSRSSRANSNAVDEQSQFQQQFNSLTISNDINGYDNPFAIYSVKMCCDGKYLIVAARGGHITLFKFTGSELEKADEGLGDLTCIEIPILHRNLAGDRDDTNISGNASTLNDSQSRQSTEKREFKSLFRAKMGYRRMAGYQPELVCLLSWLPNDRIPMLTDISINSKYGLLIFGLENGLVVVDYLSQSILMNMATSDLYGTMDPFQRTTVSPKRRGTANDCNNDDPSSGDYQQQPLSPSSHANEAESSSSSSNVFSFGNFSFKKSSKPSNPTTPRNIPNENESIQIFRSRSIDSLTESNQNINPCSTGGGEHQASSHEDKPPATLAKRFRTLRKRLSRTSNSNKHDHTVTHCKIHPNEKDNNNIKSGGDSSEASSAGEDLNRLSFTEIPTSDSEAQSGDYLTVAPAVSLKVHRSLPVEKTASTIPAADAYEKTDSYERTSENRTLSKTWSSTNFTAVQLRGTCSLEYSEHMKDKSHKRKAHMIDLRKDDHQSQLTPTSLTPLSKHSISIHFQQAILITLYYSYFYYKGQSSPPSTASTLAEKRSQALSDINSSVYKPSNADLPRSTSSSSMDNIVSNESVCAIQFSESFTYKNDFTISPSVWLGTSTGCVIVINLNIIYEPRNISVVPSGSVFRLCGRLLHISFLDYKGSTIASPSEKWDTKKAKATRRTDGYTQSQDSTSSIVTSSTTSSSSSVTNTPKDIQYAVFCSSKQARVVSLPSQTCISKQKIYDSPGASGSNVLRAAVVKISGAPCLVCYLLPGRIIVYSLPSLRELFITNLDPVIESFRSLVASTFSFTDRGHGLYMCSPTEIQKITIASDVKEQISEMLCELYSPSIAMPEAPKQNFFAKLFTTNSVLDSDQLFGDAAGKAPLGVVKKEDVNVNMNQLRGKADSAAGVINDTRMKLLERGQKLGEVEIASKQMTDRAEEFASLTNKLMLQQKEKAEWWPFTSKKT